MKQPIQRSRRSTRTRPPLRGRAAVNSILNRSATFAPPTVRRRPTRPATGQRGRWRQTEQLPTPPASLPQPQRPDLDQGPTQSATPNHIWKWLVAGLASLLVLLMLIRGLLSW